jgi:hypothetical protein
MTTLPPKDLGRGRKKLARGSDSGTMLLSEPLEPIIFSPSKSESVMDGGFTLAEDSLGRAPAKGPCKEC